MASKTQIRATQITGSFPTDGESATTEATAVVTDLGGILDHMASSIRRIHGNADWSNSAAGVFTAATFDVDTAGAFDVVAGGIASIDAVGTSNLTTHGALTLSGSDSLSLASDGGEIDITARQGAIDVNALLGNITVDATAGDIDIEAAAGDITIGATLASSKALNLGRPGSTEITLVPNDVAANEKIAIVNTAGTSDDAIKIDAVAGGLTLAAGNDSLIIDADGTDVDALKIDSAGGIDISAAGAHPIDIESTNAAGHIIIHTAHTAGQAILIDANAHAGSILDIDAGILTVDIQGAATHTVAGAFLVDGGSTVGIQGEGTISVGTTDSGVAVNIGHSTSETTVGDNLTVTGNTTVTGDLTVNGTTTTVNTTNLKVEDRFLLVATGSTGLAGNRDGGFIIHSGSASADLAFGRVANNTFGVVSIDSEDGTIVSLSGGSLVNFRAGRLEVDGAADYIDVDTDLKLVAAADILLDPAGSDVKVDGNVVPNADDGGTLGSANLNWSDIFIADAGVINLGDDQDVKLTHVANTGVLLSGSDSGGPGAAAQLQFGDSGTYLHQVANGVLKVVSDNILDLSVGAGGVTITGTTPKLTLGDAGAEDTTILFDGNAQDFYIALDDSADDLLIGLGNTVGTTPALGIDETRQVTVKSTTSATTLTDGALALAGGLSVASGKHVVVGGNVELLTDSSILALGAGKDFTITHDGTTGATLAGNPITLDSAAGLVLDADSGTISLKDGGALYGELTRNDAAFFVMSASAELHFGDNRSGVEGMAGGTIGVGASGDYTSFISNFSNTTSIVGALNTLAEGGTREKYQLTITGSDGHAASMALLINAALDHDQGYSTGKTDVFVNGQMMLSGASANDGDYKLHGQTAIGGEAVADMVTFFFALERDDVITVIKM